MKKKIECAYGPCKNKFTPKSKIHRFCSLTCQHKAYNAHRRAMRSRDYTFDVEQNQTGVNVVPTDELIQQMHQRGYYVSKAPLSQDERFEVDLKAFDGDVRKIAFVSDTHMGSQYQQLSHLHTCYAEFRKRGIKDVFHAGDLCEGNGKLYKGQAYEMFLHGADPQASYVIENYPKEKGITTYVIGGSHDYSYHKTDGHDIIADIASDREDFKYLGMQAAYADIDNISLHLIHPDGGTAYALSYRLQKIIEQYTPQNKPHIVASGHFHRCNHIPGYRNVEGITLPCFQSQTPFLKAKGIQPVVGCLFVDLKYGKEGIVSFKTEWKFFYKPVKDDY